MKQDMPDLPADLQPTVDLPAPLAADPGSTIDVTGAYHPAPSTEPEAGKPGQDWPEIPGYEVNAEIARGGMGRVLAGRERTLDREVALKVLLPGASAERFVTEARITATLPHPGIPPVYALGTLADGSPFLAMKFVHGRTLGDELKKRVNPGEDLPQFIQAFEQIAQAVGFAHTRGVIHRDLKPANVMVGAFGEVQVMDWGLAKNLNSVPALPEAEAASPSDFQVDEQTAMGTVMGTPAYMAPEQARGEPVDGRADVFALGGILTAILTGQPVFAGKTAAETVRNAAAGAVENACDRLDKCGADPELVALAKHCLQPEPQHRPTDALAVAKLVANYRLNVETRLREAETARSAAQVREAEQLKRRRVLITAGGALALALLLGIVGTSIGMLQAYQARDAEAKRATSEAAAKQQAEERLIQVEKGVSLLGSIFKDLNPDNTEIQGQELASMLRERLDQVSDELEGNAIGDELAVARLQAILAQSQLGLGNYEKATDLCQKAHDTLTKMLGPDDSETLSCLSDLGTAFQLAGQTDQAVGYFEQVYDRRKTTLGEFHADTISSLGNFAQALLADARFDKAIPLLEQALTDMQNQGEVASARTLTMMFNLGKAFCLAGKYDRATQILQDNLELREGLLGADHPQTIRTVHQLAENYMKAGKNGLALPLFERALAALRAELGPKHPDTLICQGSFASCNWLLGRHADAISLFEANLKALTERHGDEHRVVLTAKSNLGHAHLELQQYDQALPIIESVLEARQRILPADHPELLKTMNNHAQVLIGTGQVTKALGIFEELLAISRKVTGPEHPETLIVMNNLARAYYLTGAIEKALPLFEESLIVMRKIQPDHYTTFIAANNLGAMYRLNGQLEESTTTLEDAVANLERILGEEHPQVLSPRLNLAKVYLATGRIEDGSELAESVVALARKIHGAESPVYAKTLAGLGSELIKAKQFGGAVKYLRDALRIQEEVAADDWTTFNNMVYLGEALASVNKPEEAETLFKLGYEGLVQRADKMPPKDNARIPHTLDRLIELYSTMQKTDEVEKWRAERAKYQPPAQ